MCVALSDARGTAVLLQEDGRITGFKVKCLLTIQLTVSGERKLRYALTAVKSNDLQ